MDKQEKQNAILRHIADQIQKTKGTQNVHINQSQSFGFTFEQYIEQFEKFNEEKSLLKQQIYESK